MGYYSDVQIAVTKKGYERIKKNQEKYKDYKLLDYFEIEEMKINDKSIIFLRTEDAIKYYEEYEDIAQLEKDLSKLKEGYVFARFGEQRGDVEFRNFAKIKELLVPFDELRGLSDNLHKEFEKEEEEEFGES